MVYKLVSLGSRDVLKLSAGKESWVGAKQIVRRERADGRMEGDVLALAEEPVAAGGRPLLETVMRGGRPVGASPSLGELRGYCASQLAALPDRLRTLRGAAAYPVLASDALAARQAAARHLARAGQEGASSRAGSSFDSGSQGES